MYSAHHETGHIWNYFYMLGKIGVLSSDELGAVYLDIWGPS